MLSYEMLIAIGIAGVLVVAAIDRLAARVMGPEEMALLRLARAAPAQRRLVASAAQQEREARAAAAQRQEREARAAAAQRRLVAYWTHALAAPLPARLGTLITQLETQDVSA
jgi:signal transduction histidine kinase